MLAWLKYSSVSSFHDNGIALERRQHAFFGLTDMRPDDAQGRSPVAALHGFDQGRVLGNELRRVVTSDIGEADADQPIGLSDQVA